MKTLKYLSVLVIFLSIHAYVEIENDSFDTLYFWVTRIIIPALPETILMLLVLRLSKENH